MTPDDRLATTHTQKPDGPESEPGYVTTATDDRRIRAGLECQRVSDSLT
jgi:hypothetical protein